MVAAKFGRAILSTEDYTALTEAVREATDGTIDEHSVEVIFGSKTRGVAPRPVTLSTLARYVGFSGWSDFCTSREVMPAADADVIPVTRRWGVIILTIAAIVVVVSTTLYLLLFTPSAEHNTASPEVEQRIYATIDEKWRAIATEECNDIRTYSTEEDYDERIEELITKSSATLERELGAEITSCATAEGITIEPTTVEEYKSQIMERCLSIYNCLRQERQNQ